MHRGFSLALVLSHSGLFSANHIGLASLLQRVSRHMCPQTSAARRCGTNGPAADRLLTGLPPTQARSEARRMQRACRLPWPRRPAGLRTPPPAASRSAPGVQLAADPSSSRAPGRAACCLLGFDVSIYRETAMGAVSQLQRAAATRSLIPTTVIIKPSMCCAGARRASRGRPPPSGRAPT